jgi:hypothetical protein
MKGVGVEGMGSSVLVVVFVDMLNFWFVCILRYGTYLVQTKIIYRVATTRRSYDECCL